MVTLITELVFNPEKMLGNVCLYVSFLDVTSSCFPSLVPCLKFTLHNVAKKMGNQRNPRLKDSDAELENLSSLVRHSVSRQFKSCIIYRYIIKNVYQLIQRDCVLINIEQPLFVCLNVEIKRALSYHHHIHTQTIGNSYTRSFMSAHVLVYLLNKLRKRDKI